MAQMELGISIDTTKLKPYGFPIPGCIDGFFRKIIWLKVCRTNNDPKIYIQTVQHFYKQTVHHANPKCGTDCGTDCGAENGALAALQCASVGSTDAHRYGSSPLNQ